MEVDKEPGTLAVAQKQTEDSQFVQLSAEEARRKRNRLAQRKHRLRVKSVSGGEPMKQATDAPQDAPEPKSTSHGALVTQLPSGTEKEAASQPHNRSPLIGPAAAMIVTSAASMLGSAVHDGLLVSPDKNTTPSRQPIHGASTLDLNIGQVDRPELSLAFDIDIAPHSTAPLCSIDQARSAMFDAIDQTLPDFHSQLDEFLNDLTDLDDMRPSYAHSQPLQYTHPLTPMSKDMEGDIQMSNGPLATKRTRDLPVSKSYSTQAQTRFDEAVSWDDENDSQSDDEDNVSNLDSCFERIIDVVEEAGFASIDEMSATYYTARFAEDSVSYEAQSRSRSRLLQSFLQSVHTSTEHWSSREVHGYRHQIVAAAETVYVDELVDARQALLARHGQGKGPSKARGEENGTVTTQATQTVNARRVQKLWEAIAELDLESDTKNKRRQYRDKMPETWSLLCQLSRKAGLHGPQASQAILAFFTLLFDSGSHMPTVANRPAALGRRSTVV